VTEFGNLYLGNKMTGLPFFNAPWFDATAEKLQAVPGVDQVFNPAQHDRDLGLDPMLCPNGSIEEARSFNVPAGKCLYDDLTWIYEFSEGMVVGPDWGTSSGTLTEIAFHQALGLPVWETYKFFHKVNTGWAKDLLLRGSQLPSLTGAFQ
jgi:hypothetical protein